MEAIRRDRASGRLRDQPWRWSQCRSWVDGWLYIYRRVCLDYTQHLRWEGETVYCAVQYGPDFNDRAVGWLERLATRLGPCLDLQDLRLIGTRVSDPGIVRLGHLFPNAKIRRYTFTDLHRDPAIGDARG